MGKSYDAADLAKQRGTEAVRLAVDNAAVVRTRKDEVPEPVDLWGVIPPPTLPEGVLPRPIEQFARVQAEMTGADAGGFATVALTTCAAALPDAVQVQVKRYDPQWRESARLWTALVGDPSTKKSPIIDLTTRPIKRLDAELFRAWKAQKAEWDAKTKEEKAKEPAPPQTRKRLEDATVEAAEEVLADSPDGVLCIQDELSGWFGAMDKYSGGGRGAAKDRGFWLQTFNGGSYARHRVGRGAALIENLSVSLVGGIQVEPIRRVVSDNVDDGLIQRLFPIVLRPSTTGKDEPLPLSVADQYDEVVRALAKMRPPDDGALRFDDGAQRIRRELEERHQELKTCEAVNRKLAAHIGKYDGLFARLALLFHCIEHAAQGQPPAVIAEETASRAARLLHDFLLKHAASFYAALGLSDDHARLTAIAGYILAHKLSVLTPRDVQRGDRTMRGLTRPEIVRVMEQLEALGWVEAEEASSARVNAAPRWTVVAKVHELFGERAAHERTRREQARSVIAELAGSNNP
jgi:hypothetical protein